MVRLRGGHQVSYKVLQPVNKILNSQFSTLNTAQLRCTDITIIYKYIYYYYYGMLIVLIICLNPDKDNSMKITAVKKTVKEQ